MSGNKIVGYIRRLLEMDGIELGSVSKEQLEEYAHTYSSIVSHDYVQQVNTEVNGLLNKNQLLNQCRSQAATLSLAMFAQNSTIMTPVRLPFSIFSQTARFVVSHLNSDGKAPNLNPFTRLVMWRAKKLSNSLKALLNDADNSVRQQYATALELSPDNTSTLNKTLNELSGKTGERAPLLQPINAGENNQGELKMENEEESEPSKLKKMVRALKRFITNTPVNQNNEPRILNNENLKALLFKISKSTKAVAAKEIVDVDIVDTTKEETADSMLKKKYDRIFTGSNEETENTDYDKLWQEMRKARGWLELVSHPDGTNFTTGSRAHLLPSISKLGSNEHGAYSLAEIINLYKSLSKTKDLITAYLQSDPEQHEGYRYAIILRDINKKMEEIHERVFIEINNLLTKTEDNTFFNLVNANETKAQTTFKNEYTNHHEGSLDTFKTTLFDNNELSTAIEGNGLNACKILPLASAYFLNNYHGLMTQGQSSNEDQRKETYNAAQTTAQQTEEVQSQIPQSSTILKNLNSFIKSTCKHVTSATNKQTPLFAALYYRTVKGFHHIDFMKLAKELDLRLGSDQHNVSADLNQDIDSLIKLIELLQYKGPFQENDAQNTGTRTWRDLYATLCNSDAPEMQRQAVFTILNAQFTAVLNKTASNTSELHEQLYNTITTASNMTMDETGKEFIKRQENTSTTSTASAIPDKQLQKGSNNPISLQWFYSKAKEINSFAARQLDLNRDCLITSGHTFSKLGISTETAGLFAQLNTAIIRCDITKFEDDDSNLVTNVVETIDDLIRKHNNEKQSSVFSLRYRQHSRQTDRNTLKLRVRELRTDVMIKSMQFAKRQLEISFDLENGFDLEKRKKIQQTVIDTLTTIKEKNIKEKNGKTRRINDGMQKIKLVVDNKKIEYLDDLSHIYFSINSIQNSADNTNMLHNFFNEVLTSNTLGWSTMDDNDIKNAITTLHADIFKNLDIDAYDLFTSLNLNNHIDEATQSASTALLTTRLNNLLTNAVNGKRTIKPITIETGSLLQTIDRDLIIYAEGLQGEVKQQIKTLFNTGNDNDNNVTAMYAAIKDKIYSDSQYAENTVHQRLTAWLNKNKNNYTDRRGNIDQDQLNTALNAQASIAIRELFIQHFFDTIAFLKPIDGPLVNEFRSSAISYVRAITNKGTIDHSDITIDNLVLIVNCHLNAAHFSDDTTTQTSIKGFSSKFIKHMKSRFEKGELTLEDVKTLHTAHDLFTKHNINHDSETLNKLAADVDRVVEINNILTTEKMFGTVLGSIVKQAKLYETWNNSETSALGKIVAAYKDLRNKYSKYYDSKSIDAGKPPIAKRIQDYENGLVINGDINKLDKLLELLKTASSDAKEDTANTALYAINQNSEAFLKNKHVKLLYATFLYAERDLTMTSCLTHRKTVIEILKTINEILDKYLDLDSEKLNVLSYDNFKEVIYFARMAATGQETIILKEAGHSDDGNTDIEGQATEVNILKEISDKNEAMKIRKETCAQFLSLTEELGKASKSTEISNCVDQISNLYNGWKGKYSGALSELTVRFKVKQRTKLAKLCTTALLNINNEISDLSERSKKEPLSLKECHRAEELAQLLYMLHWLGKDINDQLRIDIKDLKEQLDRVNKSIKAISTQFSEDKLHPAFNTLITGHEAKNKKEANQLIVHALMRLRYTTTVDSLNAELTINTPYITKANSINHWILTTGSFDKMLDEISKPDHERYVEDFMPIFRDETKRIAADLTMLHDYKFATVTAFETSSKDILTSTANQLAIQATKYDLSKIYSTINRLLGPGSSAALEKKIIGWFDTDSNKIQALLNDPRTINYQLDSTKGGYVLLRNKYKTDDGVVFDAYLEDLNIGTTNASIVADETAINTATKTFDTAIQVMPKDANENGDQLTTEETGNLKNALEKAAKTLKILAILTHVKTENDGIIHNYFKEIGSINTLKPIARSYIESVVNTSLDATQTLTKENVFDATVGGLSDSFINWRNLLIENKIANMGAVDAGQVDQAVADKSEYIRKLNESFVSLINSITSYTQSEKHNYRGFEDFMYQNIAELFRTQINNNFSLSNANKKAQLKAIIGSLHQDGMPATVTTLEYRLVQELHTNLGRQYAELLFTDGDNKEALKSRRGLIQEIAETTNNKTLHEQVTALNTHWDNITSGMLVNDTSEQWYEAFKTVVLPSLLANTAPQENQKSANFAMSRFLEKHQKVLQESYPSPASSSGSGSGTKSEISTNSRINRIGKAFSSVSLFSSKTRRNAPSSGANTPSLNGDNSKMPELTENPTYEQRQLYRLDLALLWLANNSGSKKAKKAQKAIGEALVNVGKDSNESRVIYTKIRNYIFTITGQDSLPSATTLFTSSDSTMNPTQRTADFVGEAQQPIIDRAKLPSHLQALYDLELKKLALRKAGLLEKYLLGDELTGNEQSTVNTIEAMNMEFIDGLIMLSGELDSSQDDAMSMISASTRNTSTTSDSESNGEPEEQLEEDNDDDFGTESEGDDGGSSNESANGSKPNVHPDKTKDGDSCCPPDNINGAPPKWTDPNTQKFFQPEQTPNIDGLTLTVVPGDGHCFYHAVSVYLDDQNSDQQSLSIRRQST